MGMAGVLDSAPPPRTSSPRSSGSRRTAVEAMTLGSHGESMVPLPAPRDASTGKPLDRARRRGDARASLRADARRRRRDRRAAEEGERVLRALGLGRQDDRGDRRRRATSRCPSAPGARASTASTASTSGVPVRLSRRGVDGDRRAGPERRRAGGAPGGRRGHPRQVRGPGRGSRARPGRPVIPARPPPPGAAGSTARLSTPPATSSDARRPTVTQAPRPRSRRAAALRTGRRADRARRPRAARARPRACARGGPGPARRRGDPRPGGRRAPAGRRTAIPSATSSERESAPGGVGGGEPHREHGDQRDDHREQDDLALPDVGPVHGSRRPRVRVAREPDDGPLASSTPTPATTAPSARHRNPASRRPVGRAVDVISRGHRRILSPAPDARKHRR